jgi:aminoglycoside phosphotransferase (APT) family kinase protein
MTSDVPHAAAVAHTLGLDAVEIVPVVAGASNLAFEVLDPAAANEAIAFLRVQGHGALAGSSFDLHREAVLVRAAAAQGFPVAEVIATYSDPTAMLMKVVPGTSRPDPGQLDVVAPQYLGLVARLHATDPAAFPVTQHATTTEAIEADLEFWDGLAAAGEVDDLPILAVARRVLQATMPEDERPPVLVHGDIGPGNFMIDDGVVTAMLDWEMAHVGDPVEDLAWMWMRGAHTDFGDPAVRFAEYATASGRPIDEERLAWHLVAVMWKSCVSMEKEIRTNAANQATLLHGVVLLTYEALLGAELMALLGQPFSLLAAQPQPGRGPAVRAAERLLDLADLPREAALIAEYLHAALVQQDWEHAQLQQDVRRLLGTDADGIAAAVARATDDDLAPLVEIVARAADRAALASPKAVRRIQRALGIGLGRARTDPSTKGDRP